MTYGTHYRDADGVQHRHSKGALRRIVRRKRIPSLVPGGYVRGHMVVLSLECGHVTKRPASAVYKRAHCETCISGRAA